MNSDDQAFIEGVRARCEAATEGPWEPKMWDVTQHAIRQVMHRGGDYHGPHAMTVGGGGNRGKPWRNAEFIAHSRTDVPRLLAIISAQAEVIEIARAVRNWYVKYGAVDAFAWHTFMEALADNPTATTQAQEQDKEDTE